MKNLELKGFSIEELQERNEFTAAIQDTACCEHCCETVVITPTQQ